MSKIKYLMLSIILIAILCAGCTGKSADDWTNEADALLEQGRYDEALQAYDKAIELNPQYSEAWNNKGIALDKLGKIAEAQVCYDKAKELGYTG